MRYFFYLAIFSLIFSCQKEEKCLESFNDIYLKRYSLWFNFEKDEENLIGYDNYTIDSYKKSRKELNDSLKLTIDCALKENQDNEILYIYKMKSLFLNDQLKEISVFFDRLDSKKINKNIYFQLSLYKTLANEILDKKLKISEYQALKKIWTDENLEKTTKNKTTNIFLEYLIENEKEKFLKNIEKDGNFNIEEFCTKSREEIIKNIMIRADNFVFD